LSCFVDVRLVLATAENNIEILSFRQGKQENGIGEQGQAEK